MNIIIIMSFFYNFKAILQITLLSTPLTLVAFKMNININFVSLDYFHEEQEAHDGGEFNILTSAFEFLTSSLRLSE